jgi:prophage maintenance system killer protein
MNNLIKKFSKTFELLYLYDESSIPKPKGNKTIQKLNFHQILNEIEELKHYLISKNQASELFGMQKDESFKGILEHIFQTFDGIELLPSTEEKATNLLYYIVKDHPFVDGNKRIGAYMFVSFLNKNNLLNENINFATLTSLTLLIAKSHPNEKEVMISLICNLL